MKNHGEAFTQAYNFSLKQSDCFPAWLLDHKKAAWQNFLELGAPSKKNEKWKYSKLGFLKNTEFGINDITNHSHDYLEAINTHTSQDEIKLIFVNGILDRKLSDLNVEDQKGLNIAALTNAFASDSSELSDMMKEFESCFSNTGSFTSLNQALAVEGLFIQLGHACRIDRTVHIIHVEDLDRKQNPTASFPYHYVKLKKDSSLKLRETYISLCDGRYWRETDAVNRESSLAHHFRHQTSDILLEQGAQISYISTQALADSSQHIGHIRVIQDAASSFNGHVLAAGAGYSRQDVEIWQRGEQAEAEIYGLYAAKGKNHSEQRCALHHSAPKCRSKQLYKGVANESGRIAFLGEINVAKDSQKISAAQLNKNLILSAEAEADTKPQLAIDADDVKCSHGATVAQLREEEIFYLESRGIPRSKAKKLLIEAFANELVAQVPDERARINWAYHLSQFFSEKREDGTHG